jgi:outer membrane protein OmpA-like peptidoglycan-associated protein
MKKNISLILFALSFASAQNLGVVEYSAYYSFGFSELDFNSMPGFSISYFPIENFGFSVGAEYSWRFRNISKKNVTGSYAPVLDSEGDEFIFNYEFGRLEEEQKAHILQIPIMFRFKKSFYYGGLGLTLGFARDIEAKGKYKDLATSGYYPEYDLTLTEPQFQGFGVFPDSQFNDRIKTKTVYMLAIENGIFKKLNDNLGIYATFLWNYSLNSGLKNGKKNEKNLIERVDKTDHADIKIHSSLVSWKPWSYVLKAGVFFEFNINEKKPIIEEPPPEPQQIIEVMPPLPEPQEQIAEPIVNTVPQQTGPLYKFLFVNYPQPRTSPTDQLHLTLIEEITKIMKNNPDSKLTCIGHSDSLPSQEDTYETALQRSMRIKYHLINFSGIEAERISFFSYGAEESSNDSQENINADRTECFIE